jgi:hypothetical protein
MPKSILVVIGLLAPTIAASAFAHQNAPSKETKLSSPVLLLPRYKIEIVSGFEGGYGGRILKDGGLVIEFGQGQYDGIAADSVDYRQLLWRTEQSVNGKRVICVYTKSNELVITFPPSSSWPANFRAKIRSQQDLAEMLLMVLTFDPRHGYPVDPSVVVSPSAKSK